MKDFVKDINMQFFKYVMQYDTSCDEIVRKIAHSITVANTCFEIGCCLGLSKKDREIAYAMGIMHDIGRFEQWKRYGTYDDNKSVDHGDLSYEMFDCFNLSDIDNVDLEMIKQAIKYHTKPYLGRDERVLLFNRIILNADAYSNVLNTADGDQRIEMVKDGYTKGLLDDFYKLKYLRRFSPKTKLDRALILTSYVNILDFEFIRGQVINFKLIDALCENFVQYLNDEDRKVYVEAVKFLKENYTMEKKDKALNF